MSWWRNPDAESHALVDLHQYRYRVRDANTWSEDWTTVNQTMIPATNEIRNYNSVLLKDLDAGTAYEFQVRSVDTADRYSAAVTALGTAVGQQTISIEAPSGSVTEGDPLRFTVSRNQPHGTLDVAVRFSETGNMLRPDQRGRNWFSRIVRFGDGNATIPAVVETVDDGDASEPDSEVTAEVQQATSHPHGHLYEVHGRRGSATKTVTASGSSSRAEESSSALSVADAEATEGVDETLDFVVRLDPKPSREVTVDYRTEDGTATAGSDYTETRGTLTFAPGEDEKTVSVPIADDAVEDDGETFTLVLSNASGADFAKNDNEAVGTIRNTETTAQPDLTASFVGVPEAHDGESGIRFRVEFSDEIRISYKTLRDTSFTLTNGDITGARRVDGRRDLWEMTVAPAPEPLTIRLPETRDCAASGAVCTGDGRPLSHSLTATVAVAAAISVADAQVEEDDGAVLAFGVTLDRAAGGTVTVDYATANGTATAGEDYTATSGTLRFPAGETSKTIEVAVLDDSHDEGEETLTLRLSNPVGGRLTDGEATGTIENRDPLPKAFMARFGRTVAVQVVEQVEERIQAPRRTGFEGRVAGRELRRGMEREVALGFLNRLGGLGGANRYGAGPDTPMAGSPAGGAMLGRPGPSGGGRLDMGLGSMGFGGDSLLTGSSFALNRETGSGGILSFWSRGVQSQFYGREGDLSLDGRGRTTMFGADYATGPLLVGLSLAHSRGRGGYSGADAGVVTSSVTGLYPWLGYKVTDRITLWGVTGYGKGAL